MKNRGRKLLPALAVLLMLPVFLLIRQVKAAETGRFPGDLDLNGKRETRDAVLLARLISSDTIDGLTETALQNADLSADGTVDGNDLTIILEVLAGLNGDFPELPAPAETTETAEETTTTQETTETTETTASVTTTGTEKGTTDILTTTTAEQETTTSATEEPKTTVTETTTTADQTTAAPSLTETTAAKEPEETGSETSASDETTQSEQTTVSETTTAPAEGTLTLAVDGRNYPLACDLGQLLGSDASHAPSDWISLQYTFGDLTFAIYAQELEKLSIAIALQNEIVGYMVMGEEGIVPEGYTVTAYVDNHPDGTGKQYAELVLREDLTLSVMKVRDQSNLYTFGRLNYYMTNAVRAMNGLKALNWNDQLASIALVHSMDMADNDYFAHSTLDGKKFSARLTEAGIDWGACAENIDAGYREPFAAVDGWYNSTTQHRDVLLNTNCTEIGIGFYYNEDSTYKIYGTQDYYALYSEMYNIQ